MGARCCSCHALQPSSDSAKFGSKAEPCTYIELFFFHSDGDSCRFQLRQLLITFARFTSTQHTELDYQRINDGYLQRLCQILANADVQL